MEFKNAKLKTLEFKTALAVSIIRCKPAEYTLDEYIEIMRANFYQAFENHHDQIERLKLKLFEAKKEIINLRYLQGLSVTPPNSEPTSLDKHPSNRLETNKRIEKLLSGLNSNVIFLSNLVKLKDAETCLRECQVGEDEIFEWLRIVLGQVQKVFGYGDDEFSFPFESILHGVQVFINVFQIEWLYQLRGKLIDQILKFIDDLVRFCLLRGRQKSAQKLACAHQILVIFSTSNYLANPVISSIVKGLQSSIDYLCEKPGADEIESIAHDCTQMCNCVQTILRIRLLDNYAPLGVHFQEQLAKILNSIFINLTETFPLIAIELSKLIQLLALNQN